MWGLKNDATASVGKRGDVQIHNRSATTERQWK
jgi:hypothetical protein